MYYVNDSDPANEEIYQVRHRDYNVGGQFDSENFAFYVQDQWQVTDNLVINAGLRNDTFENFNADGESFAKLDNQWALRLGAVWDVFGDGETKAWASYGRYYLPIAANTNIRLAGAETYTQEYYEFEGFADEALGIPNLTGAKTQPDDVFADGTAKSPDEIVDQNLDSMYSDEFIAGYQFQLNDEWSMSIQGTYRELSTTIEDMAIDAAVIEWAAANGYGDVSDIWDGFHQYVLTNPNSDMRIGTTELPGAEGELVYMDLSAEELGYPDSIRKYAAVDFMWQRAWDGVWMLNAAYTWSHNWGNNEGYVRSDNGQDDAGLTTLFDQPGLLDNAYGDLPNDRRHQVKLYGAYAVTEDLTLGANLQFWTGRPINAFGYHPTDTFAQAYDSESFFAGGEPAPRGSRGRTSSYYSIDVSASTEFDAQWSKIGLDTGNLYGGALALFNGGKQLISKYNNFALQDVENWFFGIEQQLKLAKTNIEQILRVALDEQQIVSFCEQHEITKELSIEPLFIASQTLPIGLVVKGTKC